MTGDRNQLIGTLRVIRVLLFLIGITAPLVAFSLQEVQSDPGQNPGLGKEWKLAKYPSLGISPDQWGRIVMEYRAYFNDHFGFRKEMIENLALVKYKWIGVDPNDKLLAGKEGWFYLKVYDRSVEYFRNIQPLSLDELETWKRSLERIRDELKEKGIRYVFVVAPNKDTIYPEFMPDRFNRVNPQSRLDQIVIYMAEHSDVTVIDLRPALLKAKGAIPLYYKTDSHWNELGACVATEEILRVLRTWYPEIEPFSVTDFNIQTTRESFWGDLLSLGGINDLEGEDDVTLVPKTPRRAIKRELDWTKNDERKSHTTIPATTCDPAAPVRALFFRDSFFTLMEPLITERFRQTVIVWQPQFDARYLKLGPCDVVIHEMVERLLINPPPQHSFLAE